MSMRSNSKTGDVIGKPVRANLGVQKQYRERITGLVDEMYASLFWWLEAEYKRQQDKVLAYDAACPTYLRLLNRIPAFDESPAAAMRRVLRRLFRQWRTRFDEKAESWARKFAEQSERAATVSTSVSIGEVTGIAIPTTMTRGMNNALQSIVGENVSLISSIPTKDFTELEGLIVRSVRSGRQVKELREEIEKRFQMTRSRAATIARDQTNKAMESLSRLRMQENGITEAVWIHSARVKDPRHSHVAMHNKTFVLSEGMYDPTLGRHVHPGELINCQCTKAPVVPGFARRKNRAVVPGTVAEAANA